jgi:urease accessory protein UreE
MGRPKKVVQAVETVVLEAAEEVKAVVKAAAERGQEIILHLDRDPNDPRVKK